MSPCEMIQKKQNRIQNFIIDFQNEKFNYKSGSILPYINTSNEKFWEKM